MCSHNARRRSSRQSRRRLRPHRSKTQIIHSKSNGYLDTTDDLFDSGHAGRGFGESGDRGRHGREAGRLCRGGDGRCSPAGGQGAPLRSGPLDQWEGTGAGPSAGCRRRQPFIRDARPGRAAVLRSDPLRREEGPPAGRARGPGWIGYHRVPAPAGTGPGTSPRREAISRGGGSRPVSRVLSGAAIHLRRTSPCACSDLPGSGAGHASPPDGGSLPYLVLLRVGFALPPVLPPARCALTAPFHPCRAPSRTRGGLFSVALSVGSRPPGVTWHPALRSPDFPPPR